MQEMTKPSEAIDFLGSQKDDVFPEETQHPHIMSIAPKRNRRVLIINEEIEMELDDDDSNNFHVSESVVIQNDSEACSNYEIINPKVDDIEICEMDLLNETKDKIICERKKNRDNVTKQQISRVMDYDLEEYLNGMFRKIAPKVLPDNIPMVNSEPWRMNPTKKINKKNSLNTLVENCRKRKIHTKNKNLKAKQSQRRILNSVNQFKPKNKPKSTGSTECRIQEKESHLNCLVMEDIKNGESITPKITENTVSENSFISPESNIDIGLIICPYCNYKNPKENILKKHLILYHLNTKNCTECFFHSSSWHVMALHMLKHNKKKSQCPLCNKIVESPMLKSHLVVKHSKAILEQCKFCDYKVKKNRFIKQMRSLREHVLSIHSKGIKEKYNFFKCIDCSFVASRLTNLLHHVIVHKNGKQYYCLQCKFSNSSRLWMNLHKKTHIAVLYKCPYCAFRVRENYLLKYHILKCHNKN